MEKKAKAFIAKQRTLRSDKKVQIWFQDESRFGQKGMIAKLWTIQGDRPQVIRQNGFKSAYFVGAVSPESGEKCSLIFDGIDTRVMNHFLEEISIRAHSRTHIIMFVDGAGWHQSEDLVVPKNITLYSLPPYSPELNPIEQLWDYLKENYLSGRVFADMEEIFEYGVRAWNALSPKTVSSVCQAGWLK